MTNENRSRVHAGVPAGGQFAAEIHTEPGITLTAQPSPLDAAAVGLVAKLVRRRDREERGDWERRHDRGYARDLPTPPLPPVLVELHRRAENFETLPRAEQDEVLAQLKLTGAAFLLEPDQKLGNDRVRVAEDLNSPDDLGVALAAQKVVAESGIQGTITLTDAGEYPVFTVEDGPLVHRVGVSERSMSFYSDQAGADEDWDNDRYEWLKRADCTSAGGSVFEARRPGEVTEMYKEQRTYAVMMDVVAASPLKGTGDFLGELNLRDRTADLTVDGTEYTLDVSGAEPALKAGRGGALHTSMVSGFLNHLAATTGHEDGAAFANDLREVFRETDRRLIP